ncbi:TPA: hypothetical protein DIV55_06890 [Patescibacteria group bacterium]|uniref:Uncharacterized protein n=1 Tax=Candidatus Gottesmanbacteria bacterium GW2011_GWA1_43_11 TaxID=1618436 RepID=A0A0G1FED5_9BACT|nr:MAG: hypothetical protein UV59_C0009G0005 [Candidatus Gottesmanbacteria bacterium GW2011_GWA1_43_11]HCS79431.1 hypothetical protein [Patescibacteria group bacterium]
MKIEEDRFVTLRERQLVTIIGNSMAFAVGMADVDFRQQALSEYLTEYQKIINKLAEPPEAGVSERRRLLKYGILLDDIFPGSDNSFTSVLGVQGVKDFRNTLIGIFGECISAEPSRMNSDPSRTSWPVHTVLRPSEVISLITVYGLQDGVSNDYKRAAEILTTHPQTVYQHTSSSLHFLKRRKELQSFREKLQG